MNTYRRTTLERLLYPGLLVMRKLRFPAKTALMGLVLMLPLTWLTLQAQLASWRGLEATRLEVAGAPLIAEVLDLVARTQTHRGLVNRALAGDATVAAALAENRAALTAAIQAVQGTVLRTPQLDLGSTWQPLREILEELAANEQGRDARASFTAHSAAIEQLRIFLSRCAEASGLLLDPDAGPFHLMHLAVEPLVAWTEALGQMRGRGAALMHKGVAEVSDHSDMAAQLQLLNLATANVEMIVAALVRSGEPKPAGIDAALASSRAYASSSSAAFATLSTRGDGAAYFDAGTKAIGDALVVGRDTSRRLQELLSAREGGCSGNG